MKNRHGVLTLALALTIASVTRPAGAATVLRLSLVDAAAQADRIVHGDVVATSAVWSDDGLRIYTDAQVRVRETLKGAPAATVTVRLLGGQIGTIGQMVPGAPRLREGEEVVLLLQQPRGQAKAELPRVVGLSQGLYRVDRAAQGGAAVAAQELTDLHFVETQKTSDDGAAQTRLPLDQLLTRLRALSEGEGQ